MAVAIAQPNSERRIAILRQNLRPLALIGLALNAARASSQFSLTLTISLLVKWVAGARRFGEKVVIVHAGSALENLGLELLPLLNARRVDLLDNARLIAQRT